MNENLYERIKQKGNKYLDLPAQNLTLVSAFNDKIFLFGTMCGSFQCVPQYAIVLLAYFSTVIPPVPSFIHFTDHFLCNPSFSCSLLDFHI
jgi:hypothetical protein